MRRATHGHPDLSLEIAQRDDQVCSCPSVHPSHHLSDVLHTSPQVMNELLHGILARCIPIEHVNQALSTLSPVVD